MIEAVKVCEWCHEAEATLYLPLGTGEKIPACGPCSRIVADMEGRPIFETMRTWDVDDEDDD